MQTYRVAWDHIRGPHMEPWDGGVYAEWLHADDVGTVFDQIEDHLTHGRVADALALIEEERP